MGNEEWGGTGMKIERGRKIKALPISPLPPFPRKRESPIVWGGAGNARTAPLYCNLRRWRRSREIPAFAGMGKGGGNGKRVGMGKGREWERGAGMEEGSGNVK